MLTYIKRRKAAEAKRRKFVREYEKEHHGEKPPVPKRKHRKAAKTPAARKIPAPKPQTVAA